jgi:tetratricopeptide (TPR) repeat protein
MNMRNPTITSLAKYLLWGLFLLGLLPVLANAKSAGTSAANFLKIGVGARGAAMAGAQTAMTEDLTATYWNPAGLASLRYHEISLMHYALIDNIRFQNASYGFPTERLGSFSVGASILDYGSIAGYAPGGIPTGNIEASNKMITASWGKKLFTESKLSTGFTFKYLQSDLAGYKASAPMLDAGLQFPFETGQLRGLRLGLALRNMGSGLDYNGEKSDLPQQTVLGTGFSALGGNLNLALDFIQSKDADSYAAFGAEYRVFDMLHLRLGYSTLSDFVGTGFSYGIGFRFAQWNIDYALVPYGDLGNTNRVSVGYRFGRAAQIQNAADQVEIAYRKAQSEYARGNGVQAYSTLTELLQVAPWHKPSVELKARIEKQFAEMSSGKDQARMEAEITEKFTLAKEAFDRDELVLAKKGFETILTLDAQHTGSKVYLERIQNRYASLAQEAFKEGMDDFAAGDYLKAKAAFQRTLTIQESHAEAKAMLEKTEAVIVDSTRREQEMAKLAGATSAYKDGLDAYRKNNFEDALKKFEDVKGLAPDFEEVNHYMALTKTSLANVLFEQSQVNYQNGQLSESVNKLTRAAELSPEDSRIITALEISRRDLNNKNAQESQALYKEGLDAFLAGNADKAEKNWKKALDLDYTNEDAQNALRKLEEKRAYEKSQQQQ